MIQETVERALRRGRRYLERRAVPEPERNARFLLARALATDLGGLLLRRGETLGEDQRRRYGKLLCNRGGRRPLQYLLGTWEFRGIELEVSPAALIPRPETEDLVERVIAELDPGAALAADVGTGTGCIAIALALARGRLRLLATEVSAAAAALARRNVARHRLEARVDVLEGDLLAPLAGNAEPGTLDLVVANPPYIREDEVPGLPPEVRDHEPHLALVSGPTGLEAYERLVPEAFRWLRPGGLVALEIGHTQAEAVRAILGAGGRFAAIQVTPDLEGRPRVVTARASRPG